MKKISICRNAQQKLQKKIFLTLLILAFPITSHSVSICTQTLSSPGSMSVGGIKFSAGSDQLLNLLDLEVEFIKRNSGKVFLLNGSCGLGKTCISKDLHRRLSDISHPSYWVTQLDKVRGMQESANIPWGHSFYSSSIPQGPLPLALVPTEFYSDLKIQLRFLLKNKSTLPQNTVVIIDTRTFFASEPNQPNYPSPEQLVELWGLMLDLASTGKVIPILTAPPENIEYLSQHPSGNALLYNTFTIHLKR